MNIKLGYDFEKNQFITNEEKNMNTDEVMILQRIILNLEKEGYESTLFDIVAKSDNYLTLTYKEYDLVRLRYTPFAKWIKIPMLKDNAKNNIDNPLFAAQTKKNEFFWRSDFTYILEYMPHIINAIKVFDK